MCDYPERHDASAPAAADERSEAASPLWPRPERTAWRGRWIWTADVPRARNAYALFRRTFATPAAGTLTLHITADSFYLLYVDGGWLGRGPSRGHLQCYPFDTLSLPVAAGRHVLAVLVHHIGVINACVMTGRPGLLADAVVESGGARLDLSTGPDWHGLEPVAWRRDLPCLMSHFGFWEECDLRRLPADWTRPDFDAAAWAPAVAIGRPPCAPWTRLVERDIPLPRLAAVPVQGVHAAGAWQAGPVAEDDEAKHRSVAGGWLENASTLDIPSKQVAARVRTLAPTPAGFPIALDLPAAAGAGRWLTLDFGRTVSGYPELDFAATADGLAVELSYDDFTGPQGAVNPERSYARLTDRFRLPAGDGRVRPVHPRGFRYLTVDLAGAGGVTLRGVRALEETYPFEAQGGTFACADAALERFARKAAETVRICSTDCFTDCATRERVQWMEDLYMHERVAAYAFGDTALLRRALFQAAQNALPDGRLNAFMPSERTALTFASANLLWLHALLDYWLFAGGEADVRRLLPTARRVLAFVRSRADADGLIADWPGGQFWDWAPIEAGGCLALTNAAYIWALARLAEHDLFRAALGADLAERACALRTAAHRRFWDAERGLYRDRPCAAPEPPLFSQQANAMAVLAGVCPARERDALLRRIIAPDRLGPVPVGEQSLGKGTRPEAAKIVPVGTLWFAHFLCQALFEAGLGAEALAQMRELWGAHDALPTFPETRVQGGNTFLCHGWAGGPAFLLPAYVLGARPAGPGWSRVTVTPQPGGLAAAAGTIPTPHGPLAVAWRRGVREEIELTVNAPPGVEVVCGAGAAAAPSADAAGATP
jgi:hypothetical protein